MNDNNPASINRTERVLAYTIASIVGLSILSFLAVILGTALGVRDFSAGLWPTVLIFPLFGLPVGFVLIIVLLVVGARRRARESRNRT